MAPPSIKNVSIVLAIITMAISCVSSFNFAEAKKGGFSVGLINRDSPNSPFYNPQETLAQRSANAFRRSFSRVNHFSPTGVELAQNPRSTVISNQGSYLMKLSLGTPAFGILAIADTGSDLIWTQCQPCSDCYKQDAPLFKPRSSKTYRNIRCNTKQCNYLPSPSCSSGGTCKYQYSYGDQSYTNGNIAADTVTLGSTTGRSVSFPKTTFGCGFDNGGTFDEKGSGIVGLGGGPLSLVRQLSSSIDGKFSYCLVPLTSSKNTSTLNFGSNAVLSGRGVVSTPMVAGEEETFYTLILEAVSVGNKKISFSSSGDEGNIIIDSGTTLTLVPETFFSSLSTEVNRVVGGKQVQAPGDLAGLLCYSTDSDLNIPTITAHFKGADLKLDPDTLFLEVEEGVTCFTFGPSDDISIYGNLAQSNFLVGYDLVKKTVSFKPTDCSTV